MKKDFSKIDPNMVGSDFEGNEKYVFYSPEELPFKMYGVRRMGDRFRRIPEELARDVSEGVLSLHAHTSGGRIRFVTNSKSFVLRASLSDMTLSSNANMIGHFGFDLYTGTDYRLSFRLNVTEEREAYINDERALPEADDSMRLITVNMPSYASVKDILIGLERGAKIEEAPEYSNTLPAVFYGSSITQGACASRPGAIYQNILSRRFDLDYVSLGFSGSAKAEDAIVKYMADMPMSLFVLDYDHNAPTSDYLRKTHEKVYRAVREGHPNIPILMLTRPKFWLEEHEEERVSIVRETYESAKARGDGNVYMISGTELMKYAGYDGTVDNCHPNDLGFASIGRVIGDFLAENVFCDSED